MVPLWKLGLLCAVGAALCQSPRAWAQVESREGIALQNQILELRRDFQRLQSQTGQGGGYAPQTPAPATAGSSDLDSRLLDRVTQLEDEVRTLRGRLDEVDNARQRQGDDLKKQLDDLSFRMGNAGAATAGAAAADANAATAPAQPHRTPETALQQGNAALARHDYQASEAIAREIVAGHGPRQGDGQFLLAQSLAGRRDFQAAAVAYDDTYKINVRGHRAPDSLLGLATSLAALNDKPGACQTLNKLRVEFPALRSDLRTPVSATWQRAGCGT